MITSFRTLCTLAVTHTYYSEGCRDFGFIVPVDTAEVLRNGKLLVKTREGVVHILFEADGAGVPLRPLAGARLRFGMQLQNPVFATITDPVAATPLYRNAAASESLDPPMAVRLTGRLFSHDLARSIRPVTVSLRTLSGQELETVTITAEHDRTAVSLDLSGHHPGIHLLEEAYPAETLTSVYYVDSELQRSPVFGVVEVEIAGNFYTTPPALTVPFAAKEETLKYYLVVGNHTEAEFASLSVTDTGFTEDKRPQILFDRVESPAFTVQDISPAMLAKSGEQVVLFQSRAPVSRRERARKNIQLRKHGDVLIKHLPQVGAADVSGDVVIHISKP